MKKLKMLLSATLLAGTFTLSAPVLAQTLPSTINWTIPFGVGGGTDVWARFMAPHLTKQLPGSPTLVIKNVPGGGSITGTNLFYMRAKDNGSEMLGISASTLYPYMLGDSRVRYDFDKWTPIMASPTGGVVYIQPDLGVATGKDLGKLAGVTLPFAAQGPTQLELPVMLALDLLGLELRPVFGMTSRGEGRLAFERGEAKVDFQTTSAYINSVTDLVNGNKAVPLFSLGIIDDEGNTVRDPAFPDIPTFEEVYKEYRGEEPTGMQYDAYRKFLTAGFALQKVLLVPKDIPAPMKQELLLAVDRMVEDQAFQQDAVEQIGPYQNLIGAVVEVHLKQAVSMTPELQAWVKDWLKSKFNVSVE